jgi:hypothetical protein
LIWRILVILFSSSYRQLPNLLDSPLSKRLIEKISNIQSKGAERSKLRKSLSLDDLQERAVLSGINVDPRFKKASRDSLPQRGVRDTLSLEDPSGSKKGNTIPESKSSSSVRKMISTFEGTTPQVCFSSKHFKTNHLHLSGTCHLWSLVVLAKYDWLM